MIHDPRTGRRLRPDPTPEMLAGRVTAHRPPDRPTPGPTPVAARRTTTAPAAPHTLDDALYASLFGTETY